MRFVHFFVLDDYWSVITRKKRQEMKGCEATGIADIAGITQRKLQLRQAGLEARILLWVFTLEAACRHIECNLERTRNIADDDAHEFWLEVEKTFDVITTGETDEVEEFIHLLNFVNSLEPRENRIVPLFKGVPFQDFRSQLFAVIEDYKKV